MINTLVDKNCQSHILSINWKTKKVVQMGIKRVSKCLFSKQQIRTRNKFDGFELCFSRFTLIRNAEYLKDKNV